MMRYFRYNSKHCRWCGNEYKANKPTGRDGFCCGICKQAHWRAFKKYVTDPRRQPGTAVRQASGKK